MIRQQPFRLHPILDTPLARWLAAAAWMALIFAFSSQSQLPSPNDPLLNFVLKKFAHFTVYAILAFLLWRALPRSRWAYAAAWALAVLYAISDEYHQSFVALRTPTVRDVVIDACGAATALLFVWWVMQRSRAQIERG
jgi:VanZ family protein